MAAALADMRTTVADMARRVDRTASLEDLRGLLQVWTVALQTSWCTADQAPCTEVIVT
jgi:hypothetical protein